MIEMQADCPLLGILLGLRSHGGLHLEQQLPVVLLTVVGAGCLGSAGLGWLGKQLSWDEQQQGCMVCCLVVMTVLQHHSDAR